MLYLDRERLCVIRTETELGTVPKEALKAPLLEKPCNLVYFETGAGLYGLVSSGDVYRAAGEDVPVRRDFTSLRREQFMKAREIFRDDGKIHEIPVTADGRLRGEFHRADDGLLLDRLPPLERNANAAQYLSSARDLALVRPAPSRPDKQRYFERMKKILDTYRAGYTVIDIADMARDVDRFDRFLLVDAQEKAGALLCLYLETGRRIYYKAVTYCQLLERLESSEVMDYAAFFDGYRRQGVDVLLLTARRRPTEYFRKTEAELRRRFPKEYPDDLHEQAMPYTDAFFDDLAGLPGYVESILQGFFIVEKEGQAMRLQDMKSRYINVRYGERVTVGQPERYERTIWFFGPCLVIGNYVADEYTIESRLQKLLNERGLPVRVVNSGCWGGNVSNVGRISTTAFRKGDIIVALMEDITIPEGRFKTVDLWETCETRRIPADWMLDNPYHVNHHVTAAYADALMEKLLSEGMLEGHPDGAELAPATGDLIDRFFIRKYFHGVDLGRFRTAACCLLNANPFTNGHLELVRRAARETEHVYVLIVRAEASVFSFGERYAMAVGSLKDLPNVTVIPSGAFLGNGAAFPGYYAKMDLGDSREQARSHARMFAAVAAALHVTHRYLGEEPLDTVTGQINLASAELLPEYGIRTVIIPRAAAGGDLISGSRVRELAERNDPALRELVPPAAAALIFCDPPGASG